MLYGIFLGIHVLICIVLIIVVLLQAGKGSTVGFAMGGGASQTVFGSSGGKNFFARLTTGLAVAFMCTCIVLSILSSRSSRSYRGVMQSLPESNLPTGNADSPQPSSQPLSQPPAAEPAPKK
jgi:preprotein translocase subunit SecG